MRIFGFGNPLLDVQAKVDKSVLQEFDLDENSQILANSSHSRLFKIIRESQSVEYVAGGSAQNAIRVAQWALRWTNPGCTTFMGCVAVDLNASLMRKACESGGVRCLYQELPPSPDNRSTGTCAVCITNDGHSRSLVASLGAAEKFSSEFLQSHWETVKTHDIFYNEGYFITVSPESISLVSQFAAESGKIYATNISAPFIALTPAFRAVLMDNFARTDILFGNEEETRALATGLGWPETLKIEDIAVRLAGLSKSNAGRPGQW